MELRGVTFYKTSSPVNPYEFIDGHLGVHLLNIVLNCGIVVNDLVVDEVLEMSEAVGVATNFLISLSKNLVYAILVKYIRILI